MYPKPKRKTDDKLLSVYRELPCLICGLPNADPAHIKSRGSGGADTKTNLMPLCRAHHTEQHKTGWHSMADKYEAVKIALDDRGWGFNSRSNKLQLNPRT